MRNVVIIIISSIVAGAIFANGMVFMKDGLRLGWKYNWETGLLFGGLFAALFGMVLIKYMQQSPSVFVAIRRSALLTFVPIVYLTVAVLSVFWGLYLSVPDYMNYLFPPIITLVFCGLIVIFFGMIEKFDRDTASKENDD